MSLLLPIAVLLLVGAVGAEFITSNDTICSSECYRLKFSRGPRDVCTHYKNYKPSPQVFMSCLTGSEEGFSATCGASCNGQLTSSACNKIDTSDAVLRAPYIDKCLSLKLTTDGGPARSSACGSGLVSGAKEGCKEGLSILGNMDKYKAEADARAAAVGTPALGTPASPPTPPTPVASPEVAPPSPQPELVANGEASAAVNEEEEETGEGTEASNDNLRGN